MARIAEQHKLRTLRVPKPIMDRATDAAYTQVTPHVLQFLSTYHGNVRELAIGCYFQGLLDAAGMVQEFPGWPQVHLSEEV